MVVDGKFIIFKYLICNMDCFVGVLLLGEIVKYYGNYDFEDIFIKVEFIGIVG